MFYIKYILFIIHNILSLINTLKLFIFKIYFTPYFFRTYKGVIIKCEYIKYDSIILQNNPLSINQQEKQLIITYECDKLYNCYNRVIYNPENYLLTPNKQYTNYIFTNLTLFVDNCQYTLYLRTKQYNFYVCDNIINSDFIIYYLQSILRIKMENRYLYNPFYIDNLSYKLIILDHCFNQHTLTNIDTLTFHKNTFTITNKNNK